MMPLKIKLMLLTVMVLMMGGARTAQVRLDMLNPHRDTFQELLYIPRGAGLKLLACGFDKPLADALWLKALMYYSSNRHYRDQKHDKTAKYKYAYQLFDVITDLHPRFGRSYLFGGMFLMTTGRAKNARDGIRLCRKGIRAAEAAERAGIPHQPDMRWQYYLQIAFTNEKLLTSIHLHEGNIEAAHASLAEARESYTLAATMPECPPEIIFYGMEDKGVDFLQQYDRMLEFLKSVKKANRKRGSIQDDAAKMIDMQLTHLKQERKKMLAARSMELGLTAEIKCGIATPFTKAIRRYIQKHGRVSGALDLRKLYTEGFMKVQLQTPYEKDYFLFLPTGEVKSKELATAEANFYGRVLFDQLGVYRQTFQEYPQQLTALVEKKLLKALPRHPLAILGYRFVYDPVKRTVKIFDPTAPPVSEKSSPPDSPTPSPTTERQP